MTACPHCGGMLLRERLDTGAQWVCHNDACPINAEAHRRFAIADTLGVVIRWTITTASLGAIVGAFYGLWLLVSR